jgi:hypothetical protein
MTSEKTISGAGFVEDLRSGITVSELMHKYGLSLEELKLLFQQLERAGAKPLELYGRSEKVQLTKDKGRLRWFPRHRVPFPVPVIDVDDLEARGILVDIAEMGLGVKGIDAKVNEVRTFTVAPDRFFQVNPFRVQAECRWVAASGEWDEPIAGFKITAMASGDRKNLEELVGILNEKKPESAPATEEDEIQGHDEVSLIFHGDSYWRCPSCGIPQDREHDECPLCGIIVAKFRSRMEKVEKKDNGVANENTPSLVIENSDREELIIKRISLPAKLWRELEQLKGDKDDHVRDAISTYILRQKSSQYRY